jgi:hypothetical protein
MHVDPEYHVVVLDHLHTLHVGCWPAEKFKISSFLVVPPSQSCRVAEKLLPVILAQHFHMRFPFDVTSSVRSFQIYAYQSHCLRAHQGPMISSSDSTLTIFASRPLDQFLPDLSSFPVVLDKLLICLPDNTSQTLPSVEQYRELFRKNYRWSKL